VKIVRKDPKEFLDDRFLQYVIKKRRGVGMFLPTRAGVEEAAALVESGFPQNQHRLLPWGRADSRDPAVPRGGERKSPTSSR
jgi:hypothetical protein